MSSPFVTGERFPISVKYTTKKLGSGIIGVVVLKNDEEVKKAEAAGKKIEQINTQWQQANWKQSHELIRAATIWDPMAGERTMDYQKYRYIILENQMVGWDVKNEQGDIIPLSKENVGLLAPSVASALVDGYLSSTSMAEKEMGE